MRNSLGRPGRPLPLAGLLACSADVLAAGRLAGEVKISFWDAMLLVAAKASKAKRFWIFGL
jgi:hypothetical protein